MTTLYIEERCTYTVTVDGTAEDAMRAFLEDTSKYLTAVEERDVTVTDPPLSQEESIAAYDAIARVEMEG